MGPRPPVEVLRGLAALSEAPASEHRAVAAALGLPDPPDGTAWADLFLFQLHPYASVYLGPEGMLGGVARDRIAGFWRAVGRTPPAEPDHLAALLGLYAGLLDEAEDSPEARGRLVHRSAQALLHEHLAPWIFPWLARVVDLAGPFHRTWAELLREALSEAALAGGPDEPSVHLREAPPLPDPRREGGEAFLAGVLAPVRSGFLLTRADLARLAADLDLGLRAGERRYVLDHLLGQEPVPVLGALAGHARAAAGSHAGDPWAPPAVVAFWSERSRTAADLLDALAHDGAAAEAAAGTLVAPGTPEDRERGAEGTA
ncbi:MAG: molecular chaperone TorD family protein [Longimicrobiales bacterium]